MMNWSLIIDNRQQRNWYGRNAPTDAVTYLPVIASFDSIANAVFLIYLIFLLDSRLVDRCRQQILIYSILFPLAVQLFG